MIKQLGVKIVKPITKVLAGKSTRAETLIGLVVVAILAGGSTVVIPAVYNRIANNQSNTGISEIDNNPNNTPAPLTAVDDNQQPDDNTDNQPDDNKPDSEALPVDTSSPENFRQNTIDEYNRQRLIREAQERLAEVRNRILGVITPPVISGAILQKHALIGQTLATRVATLDVEVAKCGARTDFNNGHSVVANNQGTGHTCSSELLAQAEVLIAVWLWFEECIIGMDFPDWLARQPFTTATTLLAKPIPTELEAINNLADELTKFENDVINDRSNGPWDNLHHGRGRPWDMIQQQSTRIRNCANLVEQFDMSRLGGI